MKSIYENIKVEGISLKLESKTKASLLKDMFKLIEDDERIIDKDKAFQDLMDREIIGSTGIGKGFAIPHAKTDAVKDIIIGVGILDQAIDYEAIDDKPVNIVFMFLTPISLSQEYLTLLARISRFAQDVNFREKFLNAKNSKEIIDIVKSMEMN